MAEESIQLHYFILSYSILSYSMLLYPILSYLNLFNQIVLYRIQLSLWLHWIFFALFHLILSSYSILGKEQTTWERTTSIRRTFSSIWPLHWDQTKISFFLFFLLFFFFGNNNNSNTTQNFSRKSWSEVYTTVNKSM